MGWRISQKAGKFRIWSTISDAWLTDWLTRKEAIKFYYDDAFMAFKKQVIENYLSFPHHWPEYGNGHRTVIDNQEGNEKYLAWLHDLIDISDGEAYVSFVNETYEQIMKDLAK